MTDRKQWVAGIHAVTELLRRRPESVEQLLVQEGRGDRRVQVAVQLARSTGIAVNPCSKKELDRLVPGVHQGVAASAILADKSIDESQFSAMLDKLGHDPLLLILDEVTDPHNFGACLRTADAAGVDAVIVPKDKSAPLNATVHKVASGAAETVPVIRVTNLARFIEQLQARGIWLVGTDEDAETSLYQQSLTGPLAMVMGSEGKGLRRLTRESCDYLVSLPMRGSVTSLNVSVATGICLFEAVRQRSA
ncbi:MAG: 23S rRNA (guanosine(2251)-2'-O)-methyltransferase RlmB [Pseudohongiellaceae bacterium]